MVSALPRPDGLIRALRYGLAAILLAFSGTAFAQSSSDVAVVDNVLIYYAVLPAETLRTYPAGSEETRMHGGVPGGKHVHHVQIALFDAQTNARITGARVVATVNEIGLAGSELELEPFLVGDALTYGGFFEFRKRDRYQIKVRAILSDDGRVIEKKFDYRTPVTTQGHAPRRIT